MTYLPAKPTTLVTTLMDADLIQVLQAGITKNARLDLVRSFVQTGATGSTGSTGGTTGSTGSTGSTAGSTGTTGGSTGGVAPAGRLGYAASTTAIKNTSTSVAPVTVPTAPSRSLPAYTAYNANESPNGTVLTGASGSITYKDNTKLTLTASPTVSGTFRVLINGNVMAGRVDLENFNSTSLDGVLLAVYYYHRTYVKTNYGHPGGDTWLVIEGESAPITDADTEGDDPRVSFLVADAAAPVGDPPYGLGAHPGSIGDEPRFGTYLAQFIKEVGNVSYVNAFADGGDFSSWGNNAYTAAQDLYSVSPNKNVIPVYGLPMARGGQGINDFNLFANGTFDQYIKDGVKGYLNFFDEVHVRPGYEMNGTFMNWFWGGQDGTNTSGNAWVAAFKRIYTMAHQAATEASASSGKTKTVLVTWNPCHQNYNASYNPKNMYPGNDFVDYHGLDIYSPQYTQGRDNWSGDGQVYNQADPDWRIQQALNPINRIHFWDYPNASADHGPTGGEGGWGMQDAINFAKVCGKPLAIPECGSGQNFGDRGIGPVEDFVFPYYLRSRLDQAVNMGVPVLYANIWSGDEKDGGWGFLYRQRARTAIAWSSAFGGTGAALKFLGAGAGSGGSTGSTGGTTGSTGSTGTTSGRAGGNAPSSTSSAVVTDTAGHVATVPLTAVRNFTAAELGLTVDIYFFISNGAYYLGSSTDSQVASMVIHDGANVSASTFSNVSYVAGAASGGATGSTGGSGIATVAITDYNGHSKTITLDAGYKSYYQGETGLSADIYYYLDTGNNKPTIGSSADGVITSLLITRNGTMTVASGGLAGVTTYA